jgi:hypothetical protein
MSNNVHPIFAGILSRYSSESKERAWADAAESRHYAAIDAADARDEWIESRVTELMADPAEVVKDIGELMPDSYERFTSALIAILAAKPEELAIARNALSDVFGEHFRRQAEHEYDHCDNGKDYE